MTKMFFVHGTGVRDDGYNQTLQDIRTGLAKAGRGDVSVEGISWGKLAGVKVTDELIGKMIPGAAALGGVLTTVEEKAALWASLLDDPLMELRILALRPNAPTINTVGTLTPSQQFVDRVKALNIAAPEGGVKAASIQHAVNWLTTGSGAPTLVEAASAVNVVSDPTLIAATADAIVAYALAEERGELGTGPDALYLLASREALVLQIVTALSGQVLGVGDWFKKKLTEWALAKATSYGRDRRSGLMNVVSPGVGDILLTQRRPDVVNMLREKIAAAGDNLVVIGHSLGGVHLVNLLSDPQNRPPNVVKLITAGSQAPFFTACDAMAHLRLGQPLPAAFPPWLNFYDRSDFLSFTARPFFQGGTITDKDVSSGVSFPDSHGAYWRNPAVYSEIALFL